MWQYDNSDPFGNNPPNENPSGQGTFKFPLRYTGMISDSETNTFYNFHRDYDPSIGRYVESDPIGLEGGSFSTYVYVGGNPLMYVDPSGLGGPSVRGTYYPRGQMPRSSTMTPNETQQELLNTISDFLDPYNPNFGKPIPGFPKQPTPVCKLVCPSDTPNVCPANAPPKLPEFIQGGSCSMVCDNNQSMTATPQ